MFPLWLQSAFLLCPRWLWYVGIAIGILLGILGLIWTGASDEGHRYGITALIYGSVVFGLGVAGNLFASHLEHRIKSILPSPSEHQRNHHLTKATGEAITLIVRLCATDPAQLPRNPAGRWSYTLPESSRQAAMKLSRGVPAAWNEIASFPASPVNAPYAQLFERHLREFVRRPNRATLDAEHWIPFLARANRHASKLNVATPPADLPERDQQLIAAAISAAFGQSFRETLKRGFSTGDPAWAAMQLDIAQDLMSRLESCAVGAGAEVAESLERLREKNQKSLGLVNDSLNRLRSTNRRGFRILRAAAERMEQRLAEITVALDRLHSQAEEHHAEAAEWHEEVIDQLGGIKQAIDPPPAERPENNLAAAGAQRNHSFVGRRQELASLATLLNDPAGPCAVAIVAGAGYGKTELAKEFINTCNLHGGPTSASSGDGHNPAPWTARWWLDGSAGNELKSLRDHFAAITGHTFPPEPQPLPGDDPETVAAERLKSLRGQIAQACSTGRQLLVVDNAESAAQIRDYRPSSQGRLLATTRRQPIPKAIAETHDLDLLSPSDARALLAHARKDLQSAGDAAGLDAIAEHLGRHPLAIAYAAVALARKPHKSPAEILTALKAADVGDEQHLLSEFDEDDLGTGYKRPLAQSLALLLNELADAHHPDHDPLAIQLLEVAAFCAPDNIPIELLRRATGADRSAVERSLRALQERSIISLDDSVSIHRLTQSLVRSRLRHRGEEAIAAVLVAVLDALIDILHWDDAIDTEATFHVAAPLRAACSPHAETAIDCVYISSNPLAIVPVFSTLAPRAARLGADLSWNLIVFGQLGAAEPHLERSINWYRQQTPCDEHQLAECYRMRALFSRHSLARAEEDITWSINWGESQSPRNERELAGWYSVRAGIREDRCDLEGADDDLKQSIYYGELLTPRDELEISLYYEMRAEIRQARGDPVAAENDVTDLIHLYETHTSRNEFVLARIYTRRARIRKHRGDLAGAEEDVTKSIDWYESQKARHEWHVAVSYVVRAEIRRSRGDFAGTEEDLQYAVGCFESTTTRNVLFLSVIYARRARILRDHARAARDSGDTRLANEKIRAARADIERAIAWYEQNLPEDERTLQIMYATRDSIDQL